MILRRRWFMLVAVVSMTIFCHLLMQSDVGSTTDFSTLVHVLRFNRVQTQEFYEADIRQILNHTTAPPNDVIFDWCRNDSLSTTTPTAMPDCEMLFDEKTPVEYRRRLEKWRPPCQFDDEFLANSSENCDELKRLFHFQQTPLSDDEGEFPLAFIMVVEKNAEQVLRLLSAVYQPQNVYCITYDKHATAAFRRLIDNVYKCFPNILAPKEQIEITWADISLLRATMNCMRTLEAAKHRWNYVQILSWNDVPLKTNAEMVQIFRVMNGAVDSELVHGQSDRFRKVHGKVNMSEYALFHYRIPPDGLIVYKGSYAVSFTRDFVRFIVHHPVAVRFFQWSQYSWGAEEQFWSTLVHNSFLNQTGQFPGSCLTYYDYDRMRKPWISRYQVWSYYECKGRSTHGSCVYGLGDLPELIRRPELVGHKVYADYQPAVWYCMLRWNSMKTYGQLASNLSMTFYENMPSVRYHKLADKSSFQC